MKKLLLALALLFFPAVAHAGVNCSVPFNLTNGTTADATQVMANYNAILSCLSTSTAHSGANSDITSLNGLTTPITPAQGGAVALCGATGFTAKNNVTFPNTKIDITFAQAVVTTNLNAVQFGTGGSITLDFGASGVNGLDTGSQAASTTYYTYLIGNGTNINSLASLSATSPTLPSGYTYQCRIGSLRTNASIQLYAFFQQGRQIQITQSLTADAAFESNSVAGTCISNFVALALSGIPATAGYATGYINGSSGTNPIGVGRNTGAAGQVILYNNFSPELTLQFTTALPVASTIYWCNGSTSNSILVNGWVDSVNVN